ncbi:pteridine reductase [Luteimonas yindakuii]|uniref:pteridine reductase n=1 Tax=Luteimonas yindakuii TaxID=2565782 RepID=UPI0011078C02|nr:pteridine reductase [Luteimonas yindakuii]QCU72342.1 pteridine reductase [Luteimonas yindakuii]
MADRPVPVALVTGSAHRLGNAIARRLHAAGYDLALHYRSERPELAALVADLEAARPRSTLALQAELTDIACLPQLAAQTIARFGRLDALVNNASSYFATPLGAATADDWDRLFASNARAPFFLIQAAAPHLRAARGAVVNMTDIYAHHPRPDHALYCMAKAALEAATRSLALDLAPEVRVNSVAPGAILWGDGAGDDDALRQQSMLARTPLARTGTPDEVAGAVLWLLRDATYLTGESLRVDGGRLVAG